MQETVRWRDLRSSPARNGGGVGPRSRSGRLSPRAWCRVRWSRDMARRADIGPGQIYRWRQEIARRRPWFCAGADRAGRDPARGGRRASRRSRSSLRERLGCASRPRSRRIWQRRWSKRCRGDDPGSDRGAGWLAVGRTDMRKGMNGLALQVQQALRPRSACRRSLRFQRRQRRFNQNRLA